MKRRELIRKLEELGSSRREPWLVHESRDQEVPASAASQWNPWRIGKVHYSEAQQREGL